MRSATRLSAWSTSFHFVYGGPSVEYDINFHVFADNNELYVRCRRDQMLPTIQRREHCIGEISYWISANRLQLNTARTELLRISLKHFQLSSGIPFLQLGSDTVAAKEHVCVLDVTMSFDLSLDKHVSTVCSGGFFRLCQLHRVRRSVDSESAATLVHAFVTSCIDYCNAVFAGAPKSLTDNLHRVLNAAAHVISSTKKFDRGLTHLMHAQLHRLDVPDRVSYKIAIMVCWCIHGQAPQ